ncbi:MAG: alpha/beta hydrolase [Synechococcaceae bacterium WB9_2_112]|nr:alpha/beta hydrolase [Synechococcaceae bacterium WB9_2_112]
MTSERQLIAMHGWCGDSRSWDPWLPLWQSRGWRCSCGERGYGGLDAHQPGWSDVPGLKVVIAHSLGPHLLPASVLQAADALVLLTSFGRFVPAGREGKRVQAALAAMATQLRGPDPGAMLQAFLQQVAAPAAPELLQASPAREPLAPQGLDQLHSDLALIAGAQGLPDGFPSQAQVLLVQAGNDQIVHPTARRELEDTLPQADVLTLAGAGHGLIGTATVAMVNAWIEGLSAR